MTHLEQSVLELIEAGEIYLSDILPSQWCEQNRVMGTDESPFPGPFSYDRTPYAREIIGCGGSLIFLKGVFGNVCIVDVGYNLF